jgi:hypothetical protein
MTMSTRTISIALLFVALGLAAYAEAQIAVPPRVGPVPSEGNQALRPNALDTGHPVAMINRIVLPKPISADEKQAALIGIDEHIVSEVAALKESLKTVLPDEIAVLAKTAGWQAPDQQALVVALRALDPAAVYAAWTQGNPQDTAGAELAARQTDVRKIMARLEQDAEKNQAALRQDVSDLDVALSKIAAMTPGVNDLGPAVARVNNWVEARRFVDAAIPGKGPVAALPKGKITIIRDPTLAQGTVLVLSNEAILLGNEGHPGLKIETGTAVEALGLPVVTGTPCDELEGAEMDSGIMVVNRAKNAATVNYNLNGTHYVMEPGMAQRLAADRTWVIEFDRGQGFGPAAYTLSPGTYHFTPSDLGWQLFRQRFDVTLDNTQSRQEFHFIFRGKDMTVPAGATRTLTSDYPIVVQYDRGNGADFATKKMHFSGNVQVGVNETDNLWDLFPTSENQREMTALKLFQ